MKLSVWSAYYVELSPEDMILEFEKNGIHYTELADEHATALLERGNPIEVGRKFGEFARAHGVEIPQGHLWIAAQICVDTDSKIEILKKWLDLFEAIGIKSAVLHCDRINSEPNISDEERLTRNANALRKLCDYIEGKDIKISLECLHSTYPLARNADDIINMIKRVGSDRLGICLDTGHFNSLADSNQANFIITAGKYLNALHINENDRSSDQHKLPFSNAFGKNSIDWYGIMKALKQIGYDGLFNYEIPGETIDCPIEVKTLKLEYAKNIFSFLDSLD